MYLEHFGLTEYPFSITPDTEFFFSSGVSQEALNTLLVAARTGEGFIKITGEVGTGKTLLCRKLLSCLGPGFVTAYIPNPYLEPYTLYMELASELGASVQAQPTPSQQQLLKALTNRLLEISLEGKNAVVCLDEVQAMPIETLEALRLLTNLETEKRKLLQVIIFGQPELENKLNHPSIRQLKQRITFHYHLGPMTGQEIKNYVAHRMVVAGYKGKAPFTPAALWLLKQRTRCVPRLVNIVAHKSLMAAFGKGAQRVRLPHVWAALVDTFPRQTTWVLAAGLAAIVLASVTVAGSYALNHYHAPTISPVTNMPEAKVPKRSALMSEVEQSFNRWLTLWSNRQTEAYLALFDPTFPNWNSYKEMRRGFMQSAKFIKVSAENVHFRETGPEEVTVRFTQKYHSDTFSSQGIKELVWIQTTNGPKIKSERILSEKRETP